MATEATQQILNTIESEESIRKEIDSILLRSRTVSKPNFMAILSAVVDHADKKYKRQEELLEVLRSINKKE